VLLDHGKGTGKTFDWSILKAVPDHRYFLAGGLGTENIKEAIQIYHPAVIDLSSSVETDGKKDRKKILAAVKAVRDTGKTI
jgi:phosphoribosylanthranilate isomerase